MHFQWSANLNPSKSTGLKRTKEEHMYGRNVIHEQRRATRIH